LAAKKTPRNVPSLGEGERLRGVLILYGLKQKTAGFRTRHWRLFIKESFLGQVLIANKR
jgi:hypothetical protein